MDPSYGIELTNMWDMQEFDEARFGQLLRKACTKAASIALRVNGGGASADVVEPVGQRFAACAKLYTGRVRAAGLDDSAIVHAVHFVADVLVHGEVGSDVRWFDAAIDAVLELAAPSRLRSQKAERFVKLLGAQLRR